MFLELAWNTYSQIFCKMNANTQKFSERGLGSWLPFHSQGLVQTISFFPAMVSITIKSYETEKGGMPRFLYHFTQKGHQNSQEIYPEKVYLMFRKGAVKLIKEPLIVRLIILSFRDLPTSYSDIKQKIFWQ